MDAQDACGLCHVWPVALSYPIEHAVSERAQRPVSIGYKDVERAVVSHKTTLFARGHTGRRPLLGYEQPRVRW